MLILPNSLELAAHLWHDTNMGYLLIGLGFFLICVIEESINLYETYVSNRRGKTEKEQLINSSTESTQDNQLTRLVTLVFALGVHYFFSMSTDLFSLIASMSIYSRRYPHRWTHEERRCTVGSSRRYLLSYGFDCLFRHSSAVDQQSKLSPSLRGDVHLEFDGTAGCVFKFTD